jgi:hypothetical protein
MKEPPTGVAIAIKVLKQNKTNQRYRRKQLVEQLGLSAKTKHSRLTGVPTYHLPHHTDPYPPADHDIYETEEIASIWRKHRANKKHPDARGKFSGSWPKLMKLDKTKLALIIGPNESAIIRDAATGDVVVTVLRNFSGGTDEVLDWMTGVVGENVKLRRGIRVC